MPSFDSTSVLCRAKAYALAHAMLATQHGGGDVLLLTLLSTSGPSARLVNSLERDVRKSFAVREEAELMRRTVDALVSRIVSLTNGVLAESVQLLARKSSPVQTKQLEHCVTQLGIFKHLLASQVSLVVSWVYFLAK